MRCRESLTRSTRSGGLGLLAAALGDVARARGMTQVAQAAGLTREALYKALRPDTGDQTCLEPASIGPHIYRTRSPATLLVTYRRTMQNASTPG